MDSQPLFELSDADLLANTKRLALDERRATAALIAHLVEIDNRKLYLGEACSSLFVYCTRVLHLSEPAAYNRIVAARAARRFPAVLASLEEGLVHLSAVRVLAPVLTPANHRDLLSSAIHKSKHEVEELAGSLRPRPEVPSRIRKVPAKQTPTAPPAQKPPTPQTAQTLLPPQTVPPAVAAMAWATATAAPEPASASVSSPARGLFENTADRESERGADVPVPGTAAEPAMESKPQRHVGRAVVVPLAAERYKVQFTAGSTTRDKLLRAQALLRHRMRDADLGQVVDLALDLLLRDLEKQKFAATQRPRRSELGANAPESLASPSRKQPVRSRRIPAAVRRTVWERDGGRCTFVSSGGERCSEHSALEFDHIRPHADGGGAGPENVRLLCRRHNQYEARQFFGLWQSDDVHEPAGRCGLRKPVSRESGDGQLAPGQVTRNT